MTPPAAAGGAAGAPGGDAAVTAPNGEVVWSGRGPDGGTGGRDASVDGARASDAGATARVEAGVDATDARADRGPSTRAPRPGEIIIDELLVDPAGNDLGHEWLEIANVAGEPLDLASLHVSDGTTDVAVSAGVLPARGVLVLGQSSDRAHNGDAPIDVSYGTRLMLTNGAGSVTICAGACADGVVLDAVTWTAPWGDAYVGHAVVVDRDGTTCPADEPYGADGNYGSPGGPNPLCEQPKLPSPRDGGAPADAGRDD